VDKLSILSMVVEHPGAKTFLWHSVFVTECIILFHIDVLVV